MAATKSPPSPPSPWPSPCSVRCSPAVYGAAYAALAYSLACVGYLVLTRDYGTPFGDSLTPAQRALKDRSAALRQRAFFKALLVATALLALTRPLAAAA